MFVCLQAIGACSDCERPLPLLGNIIHQGGLRPDTGEVCLYTLCFCLPVRDAYPFLCWNQLLNAKQFSNVTEPVCGVKEHTSHYCRRSKHTLPPRWLVCLSGRIDNSVFCPQRGWMEKSKRTDPPPPGTSPGAFSEIWKCVWSSADLVPTMMCL